MRTASTLLTVIDLIGTPAAPNFLPPRATNPKSLHLTDAGSGTSLAIYLISLLKRPKKWRNS
jgi:hypothetical protein